MRRHVIVTSGRSGSNALVELLNSHPEVVNYGEVLGEWMPSSRLHQRFSYGGRTWEDYLEFCLQSRLHFELAIRYSQITRTRRGQPRRSKSWHTVQTVGVKEFSDHFIGYHLQDFLHDRPELQVIHLRRENLVERALSVVRLRHTGKVANVGGRAADPFTVPIEQFLSVLRDIALGDARGDLLVARLSSARVQRITYEQLFGTGAERDSMLKALFGFLGVAADVRVEGTHQRLTSPRLCESVANLDDVAAALRGTEFEVMLSE